MTSTPVEPSATFDKLKWTRSQGGGGGGGGGGARVDGPGNVGFRRNRMAIESEVE